MSRRWACTPGGTVWRGVGSAGVAALQQARLRTGSVIRDPGYVSATTSRSTAEQFAQSSSNRIVMQIAIPAGAKARGISEHSDAPHESETLIARNSAVRVVSYGARSRTLKLDMLK